MRAGERPGNIIFGRLTTGLDPQARSKVWEVVEGFKLRGGTVMLTTHYMEEAARLCNRVAIMDHGKFLAIWHFRGFGGIAGRPGDN